MNKKQESQNVRPTDAARLTRLKPKSIAVLDEIIKHPEITQTEAYLRHHPTTNRNTARAEAAKLTAKPSSQIYLNKHVQMAKKTIVQIANDESVKPDTRIKAAQDILDRTEGKAIQRSINENHNLNVNVEATQELNDAFTAFLRDYTNPT